MAYVVPTATDLKARYPAFAAVADETITARIVEAQRMVDATWTEGDYPLGLMAYAAHSLAVGGVGSSIDVQLAGFKRVKIGPLDLERDGRSDGVLAGSLESTIYGVAFLEMQARNLGAGPLIV